MKTLILILLSFTLSAQSPCTDSTYLRLKSTPIDSMTVREYHYFTQKGAECAEYQKEKKTEEQTNRAIGMVIGVTLVSSLIVLIPFMMMP